VKSFKCLRCGRALKNPLYIDVGYGEICAAKMGISIFAKRDSARKSASMEAAPLKQGCVEDEKSIA